MIAEPGSEPSGVGDGGASRLSQEYSYDLMIFLMVMISEMMMIFEIMIMYIHLIFETILGHLALER